MLAGQWPSDLLDAAGEKFSTSDDLRWIRYGSSREVKLGGFGELWGDRTRKLAQAFEALSAPIAIAFSTPPLHLRSEGGGYHRTDPGERSTPTPVLTGARTDCAAVSTSSGISIVIRLMWTAVPYGSYTGRLWRGTSRRRSTGRWSSRHLTTPSMGIPNRHAGAARGEASLCISSAPGRRFLPEHSTIWRQKPAGHTCFGAVSSTRTNSPSGLGMLGASSRRGYR